MELLRRPGTKQERQHLLRAAHVRSIKQHCAAVPYS